ncbi:hypothetical protein T440DRAFT_22343 [Plenodomus tracheiphilus IPT5]|uniref:Uncharacterized protein n=1 Tax=Plenodomus tracheiphilus IPT5 TaxID=1408161 RepID=A0A6A7BDV2_9PLEO|nr:hypothetical protein T440DRAFT_22343 [Plenodomus tracheiphilus IPT5]
MEHSLGPGFHLHAAQDDLLVLAVACPDFRHAREERRIDIALILDVVSREQDGARFALRNGTRGRHHPGRPTSPPAQPQRPRALTRRATPTNSFRPLHAAWLALYAILGDLGMGYVCRQTCPTPLLSPRHRSHAVRHPTPASGPEATANGTTPHGTSKPASQPSDPPSLGRGIS